MDDIWIGVSDVSVVDGICGLFCFVESDFFDFIVGMVLLEIRFFGLFKVNYFICVICVISCFLIDLKVLIYEGLSVVVLMINCGDLSDWRVDWIGWLGMLYGYVEFKMGCIIGYC